MWAENCKVALKKSHKCQIPQFLNALIYMVKRLKLFFIYLFIYLFIHLFVCLFVCLFIYLLFIYLLLFTVEKNSSYYTKNS